MNTKQFYYGLTLIIVMSVFVHGEVIGPWDIRSAPVSATFQSGNNNAFIQEIIITKTDIPIEEAFTGMSVIDDGLGNLPSRSIINMTFASGTGFNIPGVDMVLFEARFSSGSYQVFTSYDGFNASINIAQNDFTYTGIQQNYYYGIGRDPFAAQVWGAPIDLSDLNVPMGVSVDTIRLVLTYNGADPLGVGSMTIPEPLTFSLFSMGILGLFLKRK